MIRLMFTSLLILICASIAKADEPFFVFAPDQDSHEVVRLSCTGARNLMLYRIEQDGKLSKSTVHDWQISVRDMVIVK